MKTEARIQQECLIWLNNNHGLTKHNPRLIMFSVPNELGGEVGGLLKRLGCSSKIINEVVGYIIKKMTLIGLLKGACDTIVVLPNKTLYVEFKTNTGQQSEAQKEFQSRIISLGHSYHLIRSLEQFQNVIQLALANNNNNG